MTARLLLIMGMLAVLTARPAGAGPWSIEPLVGVMIDYESNPVLRDVDAAAEEHIAALADVPVRYDTDGFEFLFRPSGRLSNSTGYSSLASNYAHLDSSAAYFGDLDTLTAQGSLARDSSLYFLGALADGVGVRRDTASSAIDWTRFLTERTQFQLDGSWTEVHYAEPSNTVFLTEYRYLSGGPTLVYSVDELDILKLIANAGSYQSLNGLTESKSQSLQLGFQRQVTELWQVSTTVGYTRSQDSEKIFFGPYLLGAAKSDQNSTVYSATITRLGERTSFSAGASRALQPTGLSYLSRQDSFSLSGTYKRSERWDFALTATYQRAVNPESTQIQTQLTTRDVSFRYLNAQLTVNWHLTERWLVSAHAIRISQEIGNPFSQNAASTGLNIEISRQFLRTQF